MRTVDDSEAVRVSTPRGVITIGPHGRIDGLWQLVARELCTNAQVRAMCAGAGSRGRMSRKPIQLITLRRWRESAGFPAPVLTIAGVDVELWSRTEVEAWLEQRSGAS